MIIFARYAQSSVVQEKLLVEFYRQYHAPMKLTISINSEAAIQSCSEEKMFWKYAANLQENTHAEVQF